MDTTADGGRDTLLPDDPWACPFCGRVARLKTARRTLCRSRTCGCGAVMLANRPCDFDEITDDAMDLLSVEMRPESRGDDLELRQDIWRSGVEIRQGVVRVEERGPGYREEVHYVWFRRQDMGGPANRPRE